MVLSEPTKAEECRGRQQEWGWEGLFLIALASRSIFTRSPCKYVGAGNMDIMCSWV